MLLKRIVVLVSTDEESIIHVKRSKVFMSPELNDTFQLKDCFMSPKTPKLSGEFSILY